MDPLRNPLYRFDPITNITKRFDLLRGQLWVVVGPVGSGKSFVASYIANLSHALGLKTIADDHFGELDMWVDPGIRILAGSGDPACNEPCDGMVLDYDVRVRNGTLSVPDPSSLTQHLRGAKREALQHNALVVLTLQCRSHRQRDVVTDQALMSADVVMRTRVHIGPTWSRFMTPYGFLACRLGQRRWAKSGGRFIEIQTLKNRDQGCSQTFISVSHFLDPSRAQ